MNLDTSALAPTFPFIYIALCDGGPPTSGRLSVPDQDAVKGSDGLLGQLKGIKLTGFSTFSTAFPCICRLYSQ